MVRHGSSHGLSVLVCTFLAAFLIDVLKPILPGLVARMARISDWFVAVFSVPFSPDQFNIILVASFLAILWGIFFKMRLKN